MAVKDRYDDTQGNITAGAFTLALFISIFPLLILGTAVVGFLAANQDDFTNELISRIGLDGDAATTMRDAVTAASNDRHAASIVGLLGLAWAGLGVVTTTQALIDHAWGTRGRGVRDKGRAALWLVGAGAGMLALFGLTGVLTVLPWWAAPLGLLATVAGTVGLFLWTFWWLGRRKVPWRALMPGALLGGIGVQLLTVVGAFYVPHAAGSSSGLYGSIGVVFAILAWLFILGRLVVYATLLNVELDYRARSRSSALSADGTTLSLSTSSSATHVGT
jgi:membrane protein